jgi:hypothetical protein
LTGLADVTSRISEIQGQMAAMAARLNPALRGTAAGLTAGGTSFADVLSTATDSSGASGVGSPSGVDVVADAKKYLGIPYVFGSTDPAKGLDCSSLVQRVFKDLGVDLPRLVRNQRNEGTPVASMKDAKPGDLLIFDGYQHIGIYVGDGKMLHAPQPGEKVKIGKVWEEPTSIRRILPSEPQTDIGSVAGSGLLRSSALGMLGQGSGSLAGVPYANLFAEAGQRYGVSPALLAAVAGTESGYNPSAVSPDGAQGLMQIMPSTARGLGVNALDPAQAVDGAARLLRQNLTEFGSVPLALAAYNAGGGAVHKYGGVPPYAETQQYVVKVQAAMARFGGGTSS